MMNKSKIEWCDFTWNPVTGCRHGCPYCYAAKQAARFSGNKMINKASEQLKQLPGGLWELEKPFRNEVDRVTPFPVGFDPVLHTYRLSMPVQKKKPAVIFVVSMGDLFGDWVPDEWIERVFEATKAAPWHTYLFLTKNPERYIRLGCRGKLPEDKNYWYGTTITKPEDVFFWSIWGHNWFLSIEPLSAEFGNYEPKRLPGWVIVGAETGQRKERIRPQKEWVQGILDTFENRGVPVFLKNNLTPYWPGVLAQNTPEGIHLG